MLPEKNKNTTKEIYKTWLISNSENHEHNVI